MQQPSTQDCNNHERIVEIRNEQGLHMRPAMQFVERANEFEAQVTVCKGSQCVDAKSIMQVTMLAATKGTKLKITAVGSDAREAIESLTALIENETTDNAD